MTPETLGSGANPAEPLYQVKLLSALRSGDPALIHPFLAEIGKDRRKSLEGDGNLDTGAAALHLAVRCASADTVGLLLSHRAISPNGVHPLGSGTTALHLAAALGRVDIVNLLLEQESINDTLRDTRGRSIKDVARGKDVVRALQDSHSFLNASYRSLLRSYILSPYTAPPATALLTLLESPRIRFVDLSYLDDGSGTSILHEAARRRDLRLIELAVRAGADVFVRDRKGKMAYEGKDEKVKVFLRQFANHDTTLIDQPVLELPTLKGYLNKYTNVAKGYSTRWFVLKGGVLSYYRHQEDESITSRGSISMKNAILRHSIPSSSLASPSMSNPISSTSRHQSHSGFHPHQHHPLSPTATDKEKLRFEVHSTPSMRGHQPQKWYMKANHPVEAARWIQAIGRSIEWARKESGGATDAESTNDQDREANTDNGRRRSGESDKSVSASLQSSFSQRATATAGRVSGSILRRGRGHLYRTPRNERESVRSMVSHPRTGAGDTGDRDVSGVSLVVVSPDDLERERDTPSDGDGDDEGGETQDDSSAAESRGKEGPPHEEAYELQGNSVAAQMELTVQLLANLGDGASAERRLESSKSSLGTGSSVPSSVSVSPRPPSVPVSGLGSPSSSFQRLPQVHLHASSPEQIHLQPEAPIVLTSQSLRAIRTSFSTTHALLTEYTNMVQDREAWWRRTLEKERKSQKAWEESLATVVKEGETLEKELRARSRRRGSRFFDVGASESANGTIKGRRGNVLGRTVEEGDGKTEASYFPLQEEQASPEPEPQVWKTGKRTGTAPRFDMTAPAVPPKSPTTPIPRRISAVALRSMPTFAGSDEEVVGADTDEEDEFFDAIEYGTLPDLVVPQELTSPSTLHAVPSMPSMFNDAVYGGYKNLRTQLNLSEERPPTSLWSVLKHSIGKDLTRISFPVFFNEPTSMLQRMAEDMEFSECLDAAAREKDPLKRIAFVAAFAMSNYSSTIGRIAKPFNPMLGETFEYVRFDREYRYMSEQVSHHPPISACWAESPSWHYFGEVDAQNKFMGKSFEIRPTGIAHAELLIPEERGPGYPKATGKAGGGKVVEHYSWKKVTTNVSGFILGSPTIDHYGDMIITNHRTNDRCILTFKPRGWRGKDAYEIGGQVIDSFGRVAYDIAGRWNSQLIARQSGGGALNPDVSISSPISPLSLSKPLMLWKNSEKPTGSPFNLTPFAITLNDCPNDTLKPFICPTDCRLRPDQRAFELGKYELANELKGQQEDKQRATRRAREEGRLQPHRPRWFTAETEKDTGERVWTPSRSGSVLEYWTEREKVWKAVVNGAKSDWKDVDRIFIEEPEISRE